MNKQVLTFVIGRDEAVALLIAEPLYGSCSHAFPPGRSCAAKRGRCKSNNYERWHASPSSTPDRDPQFSRISAHAACPQHPVCDRRQSNAMFLKPLPPATCFAHRSHFSVLVVHQA